MIETGRVSVAGSIASLTLVAARADRAGLAAAPPSVDAAASISRSRFAVFGAPDVPNAAVPVPDSARREERGAQRGVVDHHVAVLDRELRDAGLVRGQEGLDASRPPAAPACTQRVGGCARPRWSCGTPVIARQRRVELIERAQADIRLRRQIRRRRRAAGTGGPAQTCDACRCCRRSGRTGRRPGPSRAPMTVPTVDSSWPVAGGVVRVADGRVQRRVGLADVRLRRRSRRCACPRSACCRDRGARIEADEGRLGEQVAVAVVLAGLEHDVALRHVRPGALTLNSRKYFSPTPASKFCWICVGVSARLWIATRRSTPCHWRLLEVSLPSTSAKVSSQSASVPPPWASASPVYIAVHVDAAAVRPGRRS